MNHPIGALDVNPILIIIDRFSPFVARNDHYYPRFTASMITTNHASLPQMPCPPTRRSPAPRRRDAICVPAPGLAPLPARVANRDPAK